MFARPVHAARASLLVALLCALRALNAQQPEPHQPEKSTLDSGIERVAGQEATTLIRYVRLALTGTAQTPAADSTDHPQPPTLMAQCTLRPNGKSIFELFATFSGIPDMTFYPPWTPTSREDLFPPRTDKVNITMEFLGYTHVKPVRRQWEIPVRTPGQYRYNPPGGGSSNLEEIAYYLRYLLALPILRLTLDNRTAEFLTTPLLNEIRKEPLCRAASL